MAIKSADQISIVDLTDGYSVILTSDGYTFPGTTTAAKAGSCTTQVIAMCGSEQVSASVDLTAITAPTGITVTKNTDTTAPTLTITASTSFTSAGLVTIPVTVDGEITIIKQFSVGIALTGATGGTGAAATNVILGMDSATVACTKDRAATAASTITIPFAGYQGTSRKACSCTVGTLPSGVTSSSNTAATTSADGSLVLAIASGANFGGTAASYDNVSITLTFSCNGITFTKMFTLSKSITGATGSTATLGSNSYTTTYGYTAGNTSLYGAGATTSLVASITQGSGANAMNFAYTYDSRGNIISETRNGLVTTYVYDALGQLIRVNDPHESATWVYNYDRGGNITSKVKYAYTTGTLGTAQQTIPYSYGDSNWKDKLTSYDGKAITYDAIGNPLNDGERTYTWGAGRQLRHISMPLTGVEHGFRVNHGIHEGSNTKLCIVREDTKLKAKLLRDGRDVTTECAASAFVWKKNGSAAGTGKEIAVTTAEINGDVQFSCTYTETQGVYGTVQVNNNLVASHTPATADANHTFSLVNGMLNVEVPNSAGNGTDYALENGVLSVNPGFTGSITAEYEFTTSPTREIDFKYNHDGLRTQKIVVENGVTTTYDYTLHGKLITHLTKRTVNENGAESTEELHFFYDAQSKPAFVEYDGAMYRYIHNLQGDIVAIVDAAGNLVVEYKYDAWGKLLNTTGTLADTLGKRNPFRYRGYVYDEETELYYLRNRCYHPKLHRFICADKILNNGLLSVNVYAYCANSPVYRSDPSGNSWISDILHAANSFFRKHVDTAKLGAFFLNMKKDSSGVYHADYDCWQQHFGYNNLYDWAFDLGTSMLAKKFPFVSGNKKYILWMWKGDYLNLGAGAEIGIYTGGEPHWKVDKSLAMNMSMSLVLNGSNIATWSARHWWLTSFNPSYQNVNATDLTVTFSVTFDSAQMYFDFKNSTDEWNYDDGTYTASYTY